MQEVATSGSTHFRSVAIIPPQRSPAAPKSLTQNQYEQVEQEVGGQELWMRWWGGVDKDKRRQKEDLKNTKKVEKMSKVEKRQQNAKEEEEQRWRK